MNTYLDDLEMKVSKEGQMRVTSDNIEVAVMEVKTVSQQSDCFYCKKNMDIVTAQKKVKPITLDSLFHSISFFLSYLSFSVRYSASRSLPLSHCVSR